MGVFHLLHAYVSFFSLLLPLFYSSFLILHFLPIKVHHQENVHTPFRFTEVGRENENFK